MSWKRNEEDQKRLKKLYSKTGDLSCMGGACMSFDGTHLQRYYVKCNIKDGINKSVRRKIQRQSGCTKGGDYKKLDFLINRL